MASVRATFTKDKPRREQLGEATTERGFAVRKTERRSEQKVRRGLPMSRAHSAIYNISLRREKNEEG